jgi:putative alpha-1,2-mannosidase
MPRYQTLANGGIQKPIYGNVSDKATSGPMNDRVGAVFSWDEKANTQIVSRIGISFISPDRARSYIESEIPSWKVNDTVKAAVKQWNEEVFSKMQVPLDSTANMTHVRLLYSSLYFMHLMPSDRTGENPLWQSEEPYWDDFYTLCQYP